MKKTAKNINQVIVSALLFFFLAVTTPGVLIEYGFFIVMMIGILLGLIILALPRILRFFKFPRNFFGKFIMGTLIVCIILFMIDRLGKNVIHFEEGEIGNINISGVIMPWSIDLPNKYVVIIYLSVVFNLCSIILYNLSKGKINFLK